MCKDERFGFSKTRNKTHRKTRWVSMDKGNNKITELRAILQRESQNS
jgi:hypothetical protein